MTIQQINTYWSQMESKCLNMKFTKNQRKILAIARDYHKCIMEGYVGHGLSESQAISKLETLRNMNNLYNSNKTYPELRGDLFPNKITSDAMAYAWVMKVGDHDSLVRKMLPHWYFPTCASSRYTLRGYDIDTSTERLTLEYKYIMVLAILAYLIQISTADEGDKIISIKVNKQENRRYVFIKTQCYKIEFKYSNCSETFEIIETKATRKMIRLQRYLFG